MVASVLFAIAAAFLGLRLCLVSYNLWSQPYMKNRRFKGDPPHVAILIPARNEAHNLPYLLSDLKDATYPNLSVTVLDDHSRDQTKGVVAAFRQVMANLSLMQGRELPDGWLGKNWACHQLAMATNADYLLFLDADVRLSPEAIEHAMGNLQAYGVKLYTLFPRQAVYSLGEKLMVPAVYYTLATLLPIPWVRTQANPAFSAANGQFMLMDGRYYYPYHWHKQLRAYQVEDMAIMKQMKAKGLKVAAELTYEHMSCRMYHGFRDALSGFSKNFKAFFADSWLLVFGFLAFGVLAPLVLMAFAPFKGGLLLLAETLLVRPMAGYLLGFCVRDGIILSIPQMVATLYLGLVSTKRSLLKENQWKGRALHSAQSWL